MMEYYPPRTPTMATLNREIPGFDVVDHLEEQRSVCSGFASAQGDTAHRRVCRVLELVANAPRCSPVQVERRRGAAEAWQGSAKEGCVPYNSASAGV